MDVMIRRLYERGEFDQCGEMLDRKFGTFQGNPLGHYVILAELDAMKPPEERPQRPETLKLAYVMKR